MDPRRRKSHEARTVKTASRVSKKPRSKNSLPNKKNKTSGKRSGKRLKISGRRPRRGKGGGNPIPRVGQRDRENQIQELWTPVFPARSTRRLRYSTNLTLTSTSGVVASYVFSANGLFDPDITSTGHQPMGFDQMMLSYNHYTVVGAHFLGVFKNTSSSTPTICVTIQPSPTPITDVDQIIEYGLNNRDNLEYKGVQGSVRTLEERVSIKKIQGVNDVVDVTDLQGNAAANPVEQTYFIVQCWDAASGVSSVVTVEVVIEFTAIFTEPRDLPKSLVAEIGKLLAREQKFSCSR